MGEPGNTHQIGKGLRLGVHQHLDYELCAKLWDAQRTQLAAADILRRNP